MSRHRRTRSTNDAAQPPGRQASAPLVERVGRRPRRSTTMAQGQPGHREASSAAACLRRTASAGTTSPQYGRGLLAHRDLGDQNAWPWTDMEPSEADAGRRMPFTANQTTKAPSPIPAAVNSPDPTNAGA